MSYRRPLHEPFWQGHGPGDPSSYHQRVSSDDFGPTTTFNIEEYMFGNEAQQPYHQEPSAGPAGQAYLFGSQYPSVTETHGYQQNEGPNPAFNRSPNWPPNSSAATPPVYENHPASHVHDGRMDAGPSKVGPSNQQPQVHLNQGPRPQPDRRRSGTRWRENTPPRSGSTYGPPFSTKVLHIDSNEPKPLGVTKFSCADSDPGMAEKPELLAEPRLNAPPDPAEATEKTNDPDIILHPVTKEPVKRKPNGTYELVGGTTKKKAKSAPPTCPKPRKLPEEIGDGCYCELCDVVCSGPVNLRMHINGAKHKLNEAKVEKGEGTIMRRRLDKKLRSRFEKEGPIPSSHNQEETPLIGLDFVTRVVVPDQDESEDLYECSLCDKKDLRSTSVYEHVLGRSHRKAYIRKLKPDLADQYASIATVYSKNGQLKRRPGSDLSALLNGIIKVAAKRDGPGEMQIRLYNEKEVDGDGTEDYGIENYESDPDNPVVDLPLGMEPEDRGNVDHPGRKRPNLLEYPSIPRSPYRHVDPRQPSESTPERGSWATPSRTHSHQRSNRRTIPDRPSRSYDPRASPPGDSLRTHSLPVCHPGPRHWDKPLPVPPAPSDHHLLPQSVKRLTPWSASPPPTALDVTRLPPKETLPTSNQNRLPADLSPLTEEQLRFYCSDIFIAQEYRRRFGDRPSSQESNQTNDNSNRISQAKMEGVSVETLLESLSDTMVQSEDDAKMAMELTRALTQATLKFMLQEKDFAIQKMDGKR
ncbi:uncharacterized protein LOC110973354 isoform X1 [Acanthaster planci]|uniref:Uncharacterized protein LOC110973354 isoform X1 n=1 Tax=Acanthaster planci TaxID=133434 RepID=A0A8B7XIM2_ACAPL|nr:uncharacterized protein LOC110973354 isoform X1 [Acanthaster planci]